VNPHASDTSVVRAGGGTALNDVEKHFVLLLNQICTKMAENATLLEFFFDTAGENKNANISTQLSSSRRNSQKWE
jgi:hypothetical protein